MIDCYNPYTGEVEKKVKEDNLSDVLSFLEVAKKNEHFFRKIPYEDKRNWMDKFCQSLSSQKERCAKILTLEMGKPLSESISEIEATVKRVKWFINNAENFIEKKSMFKSTHTEEYVSYDPLGVVLNISAWNYPYFLSSNVFAPALLCGNIVLYKGSEVCPETSKMIESLLLSSGFPEYSFKSIVGGKKLGKGLVDLSFDGLFFTGSKETGQNIFKAFSSKIVPVTMELGGKDAVYVCDDSADQGVVDALVSGCFYNGGQSCCSVERLYVHESVYDQFVKNFVASTERLKLGNPLSLDTQLGPLARREQIEVLNKHKNDALQKGASLVLEGGEVLDQQGWFFKPCVLSDVTSEMLVMGEESFGPIVGVQKVKSDDEAKALINQSEFGLTAGIYTLDKKRALEFLKDLDVGTVYWNMCDRVSPYVPWSGRKNSGLGSTLSHEGIACFLKPKSWQMKMPII